tara:strand:+ start:151 stop:276 length:126 start_codon:yes stop_codon:yes gene_type:complete
LRDVGRKRSEKKRPKIDLAKKDYLGAINYAKKELAKKNQLF